MIVVGDDMCATLNTRELCSNTLRNLCADFTQNVVGQVVCSGMTSTTRLRNSDHFTRKERFGFTDFPHPADFPSETQRNV
mmetsp:Transcript_21864/g.53515  ORF Transcript_21864/g.53515 Transcript_21864/m.53515 type:complete len:80 (-) Transcript_21864:1062-1301(-)